MSDAPPQPSALVATICLMDSGGRQLHIQAPLNATYVDIGPVVAGIGSLRFERTDDIDPLTLEHIYRQKL